MLISLPGSWKGTRAKLYRGLFGLLRDVSKILDAPSITWTRSSYMEPVTSKTNARVDAPSGMSSFEAPLPASCPVENATDSARDSHTNLMPISDPRVFSSKVFGYCSRQSEPQGDSRYTDRDIGLSKLTKKYFKKISTNGTTSDF